jgi:peptidoglycan hydrolase-like protein with peptidoglycan-binding domain
MHGCLWCARGAAIAISLCTLLAGAAAAGHRAQFAQDASEPGREAAPSSQLSRIDTPAVLRANSPEQIRKAQTELRRLDCLTGRIDGKLGDQTRQAVKKFWTSAKQPAVEVNITDDLIAQLAVRGDLFCRPVRRFFGFGGRSGGNSARLPLFVPGAGRGPVPAAASPPSTVEHKD